MIDIFKESQHGRSEQGWLKSWFHFSFAKYYNPKRMQFGALRVVNDDLIEAGTGFDAHPHRDMEIVSYVVDGSLTHTDSMGNRRTLTRGQVQYMSAGTGVTHSEYNTGKETTRILQIWILPDKKGRAPRYGDYPFEWGLRGNRWLRLVSPQEGDAPVKIYQDANIDAVSLEKGRAIRFDVAKGRQAYLVLIEGSADINGNVLRTRDGLESIEDPLNITAQEKSHLLAIELKKL